MRYVRGERIGRTAPLAVGCAAVVRDGDGKVLVTRRRDNGRWCLPSGAMEPGESVSECCRRETLEETGVDVEILKLTGVYSDPNVVTEYADGNRYHVVSVCFLCRVAGGEPRLSEETIDVGFVRPEDLPAIDMIEPHRQRLADALADLPQTVFA